MNMRPILETLLHPQDLYLRSQNVISNAEEKIHKPALHAETASSLHS
jgi:hypothetical protein